MPGLLGKKIGMTSVFSADGKNVPCTVIEAGPCVVTQIKSVEKDGYAAVQVGFQDKKEKHTTKPLMGHFKKAGVTPSTFYNIYHTKGSILTELTEFMFGNQFNISGKIVGESTNPVLLYAVETCLQLTLAELNENLREIYVEAYTVPENIELIHKKTAVQLQKIFASYLPGYSASDFYEMEIGTAAFMRGYMARPCDMYFTLERKLARFLSMSLSVFKVPQEEQEAILSYIENLNIREIANKVMQQLFVTLEMKYEFTLTN